MDQSAVSFDIVSFEAIWKSQSTTFESLFAATRCTKLTGNLPFVNQTRAKGQFELSEPFRQLN